MREIFYRQTDPFYKGTSYHGIDLSFAGLGKCNRIGEQIHEKFVPKLAFETSDGKHTVESNKPLFSVTESHYQQKCQHSH